MELCNVVVVAVVADGFAPSEGIERAYNFVTSREPVEPNKES